MAIQYPRNVLYNKLMDVSQSLGEATRQAKIRSTAPASTTAPTGDISQYQNLPKSLSDIGSVTVPYMGSTSYEPGGTHLGLDLGNVMGTPIPSFTGGTVTDIRTGQVQGDPDFGNFVTIITPQGDKVRYSHLSQSYVKVDQKVKPGDVLGTMGNTGQTYSSHGGDASHLDLRIQTAYNNQYVNPITYLRDYKYE